MVDLLEYWKEFGGNTSHSIKDDFSDSEYPEKEMLIHYLESGDIELVSLDYSEDVISGEIIGEECIMTDGEYSWDSSLPYYVKKYNLILPDEFVKKVAETLKKNS